MACIALDTTTPQAAISAVKMRVMWRNMHTRAVFPYANGAFAWDPADLATCEKMGLKIAAISVAPGTAADIYDVETGDWDPAAAATQMGDDARAGHWPVAYVNRSNMAAVIADLGGEGLGPGLPAGRGFGLWVATLDGTFDAADGTDLRTHPGVVGVQVFQSTSPVHQAGAPPDLDVTVLTAAGEQWLGLAAPADQALAKLEQLIDDAQALRVILKTVGA